jgi:hypothetical protein
MKLSKCILAMAVLIAAATCLSAAITAPYTNQDIVNMVDAKIADATIKTAIASCASNFDTSAKALIELKNQGVSDDVLQAMLVRSKIQQDQMEAIWSASMKVNNDASSCKKEAK